MATSEGSSKALKTMTDSKTTFVNCSRAISSNFAQLRNDNTYSDITFIIGSKRYHAHKLLLATASPVFRQMFQGNWMENKGNSVTLTETAECMEVFGIFLDFIYGCNNGIIRLNTDNVVPLLTLADKYEVLSLKDICSKFMETSIEGNIERALTWLSFAEQSQLTSVVNRCYDVICWNLKKAASYQDWGDITFEQLLVILKREDVVVDTEYDVFIAVETWFASSHYWVLNEGDIRELLSCIEFKNMTMDELQKAQKSSVAGFIVADTDDLCDFDKNISNAVGLRAFEKEFCLAVKTRRRYLKTTGTNEIGFRTATASHLNSTTLGCTWVYSVDNNTITMRCDFTFVYNQAKEKKVFKIAVFRNGTAGSYFGSNMRSQTAYYGNNMRSHQTAQKNLVVGVFMIKNRSSGIIQHVLQCNVLIAESADVADGDSIIEFPGIPCLDIGQFEGHYLGKFEILYKIAMRPHLT